jgi:enamine deaminase RidA (YjgF/YER057c/UK114 family)
VKITIFLKDVRHVSAEISVRERLFEPGRYPICTLLQVANLGRPDLLMEVDAIAHLG